MFLSLLNNGCFGLSADHQAIFIYNRELLNNNVVIIVVSDTHLGYSNSNSKQFEDFLDDVYHRGNVKALVILGDFIDMWRRDVSGIFLENSSILQKLLTLKQKMKIYCVAGNHDYHLRKLQNHEYPLEFREDLVIPSNGKKYRFKHGWEFDLAQNKFVMERLCHNMSDEAGKIRSDFWDLIKSRGKISKTLKGLFDYHKGKDKYLKHLLTPPRKRLTPSIITDVERRAFASVKSGEILVFGHTHRPFVSSTNNLVNAGSWVSDEEITNTYVELEGVKIRLMRYGKGEITDRVTF